MPQLSALLILIIALTASPFVKAQPAIISDPISLALSNCNATLTNHYAGLNNPAGLASIEKLGFTFIGERRYNIKELSSAAITLAMPTKYGTCGCVGSRTGFATWHSSRYGAAFARNFGKQVLAAFQLNYWSEYQVNAGTFSNISSQVGVIYLPFQNLSIGINILNPEQSSIDYGQYTMPIPSVFSIGTAWKALDSATLFLQINNEMPDNTNITTAIEGLVYENIFLRGGYSFTQQEVSAGCGISVKSLQINMGILSRQPLGLLTNASIAWICK